MDLLFKRYTSPFILVNQMIQAKQFSDFVNQVHSVVEDERLWDFFLHKINGQSFNEFMDSTKTNSEIIKPINFETTISDSYEILQGFTPE